MEGEECCDTDPPKKNIYIVLDYLPKEPNCQDEHRDKINFSADFEKNGWHGIYAKDITDANAQLKRYLGDNLADNIVLETHGWCGVTSGVSSMCIDNNAGISINSVDMYDASLGTIGKNDNYVKDLVSIVSSVKLGGNFFLNTCHTGENDYFGNSLMTLVDNKVNLILNLGEASHPFNYVGDTATYSTKLMFDVNLSGKINSKSPDKPSGAKIYKAASKGMSKLTMVSINSNGINYKF